MQPLVRSTPQRVAGALVVASLLGVGFLPLFGGPGYEQSLASGLIVPSVAAVATALDLSRDEAPSPFEAVGRGVASGLVLGGLAFGTALLHALRVGLCDLVGGAVGFALTALAGAVLGGVWGACVAEGARGRKRRRLVAVTGGLALPLASALVSVGRFYTSPMIFAFDPFAGYFSGTLYDTVIDAGTPLVTYRVGSLASLAAVTLLASVLTRAAGGRLGLVPFTSAAPRGRALLSVAALVVSLTITASGPALGHWQTASTIARELGGARSSDRFEVVYPDSLDDHDAFTLLKDCEEQLDAVEKALGAKAPGRIRAYFFRDSGEKKRLMGAADTLIAKPWRREVYLQVSRYPHPVLGHELAHVVAGGFGRGPFRVAGSLGGLWPDPGRIEGVAVAASPDDDELSDAQWAHAMLDLGALPPLRDVFSLRFLGVAASKSYTLAGGFVRFLLDRYGTDVVRAWYGGAPLEALTGKTWDALDADFRAYVTATPLSPEARSFARARFERASVFGRRCPHVVDALRRKADACRDAHRIDAANEAYREVLALDPHDWAASYALVALSLLHVDGEFGAGRLDALLHAEETPRPWRDRTKEALLDRRAQGIWEETSPAEGYRELAARSLDEDFARTLDVKALAVDGFPAARPALDLLLGHNGTPPDPSLAALDLGRWEAAGESPLSEYLVGRMYATHGRHGDARGHLDHALEGAASLTPRIARETLRLLAVGACHTGWRADVDRVRALVLAPESPFPVTGGRRAAILRLLDRCHTRLPATP